MTEVLPIPQRLRAAEAFLVDLQEALAGRTVEHLVVLADHAVRAELAGSGAHHGSAAPWGHAAPQRARATVLAAGDQSVSGQRPHGAC